MCSKRKFFHHSRSKKSTKKSAESGNYIYKVVRKNNGNLNQTVVLVGENHSPNESITQEGFEIFKHFNKIGVENITGLDQLSLSPSELENLKRLDGGDLSKYSTTTKYKPKIGPIGHSKTIIARAYDVFNSDSNELIYLLQKYEEKYDNLDGFIRTHMNNSHIRHLLFSSIGLDKEVEISPDPNIEDRGIIEV